MTMFSPPIAIMASHRQGGDPKKVLAEIIGRPPATAKGAPAIPRRGS